MQCVLRPAGEDDNSLGSIPRHASRVKVGRDLNPVTFSTGITGTNNARTGTRCVVVVESHHAPNNRIKRTGKAPAAYAER